jgi:hypothetical protein
MATLLNIHVASAPTVSVIPKITMSNLGLLTRAVNMSQVANPTNMEPEDYNAAAFNNQEDIWWLAMPTEMFEAMTPPTGIPTTLKGNCLSPRWDKLILSATPTLAMFTLFFHSTELHLESSSWNKVKLMCLDTNLAQQRKRLGQSTVNLLNRGYNMASQLQIETGQQMRLTEDEIISIQTWDVKTVAQGGNVIQAIAQATSWQQGYVWHYNVPIPIQQVTGPQHGWFAALVNALEYTGFQACSKMPMEIQHHLGQILEGQHPLQQGVQIPYWLSKTPERPRGNINVVLEYIKSSTNFGRFVEEFNNYHGATMEEDQQMEG